MRSRRRSEQVEKQQTRRCKELRSYIIQHLEQHARESE